MENNRGLKRLRVDDLFSQQTAASYSSTPSGAAEWQEKDLQLSSTEALPGGTRKRRHATTPISPSDRTSTPSPIVSDWGDVDLTHIFVPIMWKNALSEDELGSIIRDTVIHHTSIGSYVTIAGVRTKMHLCSHGHLFFTPEDQCAPLVPLKRPPTFYM